MLYWATPNRTGGARRNRSRRIRGSGRRRGFAGWGAGGGEEVAIQAPADGFVEAVEDEEEGLIGLEILLEEGLAELPGIDFEGMGLERLAIGGGEEGGQAGEEVFAAGEVEAGVDGDKDNGSEVALLDRGQPADDEGRFAAAGGGGEEGVGRLRGVEEPGVEGLELGGAAAEGDGVFGGAEVEGEEVFVLAGGGKEGIR